MSNTKIDRATFLSLRKIVGNVPGAHAEFRLLQTLEQEANLAGDFVTKLTAVMPADFKDWHQNAPAELPEVAAWVIENLRNRCEEAEANLDTRDRMMDGMANRILYLTEALAGCQAQRSRAVALAEQYRALADKAIAIAQESL